MGARNLRLEHGTADFYTDTPGQTEALEANNKDRGTEMEKGLK